MYNKYIKTDNKKKQHVYYANITTTRHFAYSKRKASEQIAPRGQRSEDDGVSPLIHGH